VLGLEGSEINQRRGEGEGEEEGEESFILAVWGKSAFSLAFSFAGEIFQTLSILLHAWELRQRPAQDQGSFVLIASLESRRANLKACSISHLPSYS